MVFGSGDFHLAGELHPGHQISGGPDASHAGRHNVGNAHAEWVADAYLQSIGLTDFYKRF